MSLGSKNSGKLSLTKKLVFLFLFKLLNIRTRLLRNYCALIRYGHTFHMECEETIIYVNNSFCWMVVFFRGKRGIGRRTASLRILRVVLTLQKNPIVWKISRRRISGVQHI